MSLKNTIFFSAQTAIYGHTTCKPVLNTVKPVTPGLKTGTSKNRKNR